MNEVIYADILFIINFSMDFLSLLLTSKLMRLKAKTAALVISSAIGAVFAVASTVFSGNGYVTQILNFAVSVLMCYISFSLRGFFTYISASVVLYGVGFALGGIMTVFYTLLNNRYSPRTAVINGDSAVMYSSVPIRYFALLALIAGIISFAWGMILRRRKARSVTLEITVNDKEETLNALCDSGNMLSDPISGLPVILIREKCSKKLLPEEIFSELENGDYSGLAEIENEDLLAYSFRLIPAHGVGGEQMLIGFQSDKIIIDGNLKCAVCAVCSDSTVLGYDAIVPAEICD